MYTFFVIITVFALFLGTMGNPMDRLRGNSKAKIGLSNHTRAKDYTDVILHRSLFTEDFTCTFAAEDCNHNGVCNQAGNACICDDDYATHDATVATGECNYKRKSGLVALLLSIFVGEFGAVFFYVGDTTMGYIQLFLAGILAILVGSVFGAFCGIAIDSTNNGSGEATHGCATVWGCGGAISMIVMYIIVLVAVVGGNLDDSNGISLSPI